MVALLVFWNVAGRLSHQRWKLIKFSASLIAQPELFQSLTDFEFIFLNCSHDRTLHRDLQIPSKTSFDIAHEIVP